MVRAPIQLPKWLRGLLWGLLLIGVVTFLVEARGPNRLRAWQTFLVNFLFFSGMAQGGLVFAAAYDLTRARWGEAVRRLAQGMAAFLPVSLLLFLCLFPGSPILFPWVLNPIPEKQTWLNLPFLFSRDLLGLLALYSFGLTYLFCSLRPEIGAAVDQQRGHVPRLWALFTREWRGIEAERERNHRLLAILSPLFIIFYALVFSLLGFDLVMSLDRHFVSSLFGAYFFMSSFYVGLAGIALFAVFLRRPLGLEGSIGRSQFHDLGKLLFGFCLVAGDFFWSQYAVIWYGNLPEETEYVIVRTKEMPWAPLALVVLIVSFLGPFLLLLSRRIKEHPITLAAVASLIVVGMWLERFLLVVPSLWHKPGLPLGWIELFITSGFLAAFVLTYLAFVTRLPIPASALSPLGEARGEAR